MADDGSLLAIGRFLEAHAFDRVELRHLALQSEALDAATARWAQKVSEQLSAQTRDLYESLSVSLNTQVMESTQRELARLAGRDWSAVSILLRDHAEQYAELGRQAASSLQRSEWLFAVPPPPTTAVLQVEDAGAGDPVTSPDNFALVVLGAILVSFLTTSIRLWLPAGSAARDAYDQALALFGIYVSLQLADLKASRRDEP